MKLVKYNTIPGMCKQIEITPPVWFYLYQAETIWNKHYWKNWDLQHQEF